MQRKIINLINHEAELYIRRKIEELSRCKYEGDITEWKRGIENKKIEGRIKNIILKRAEELLKPDEDQKEFYSELEKSEWIERIAKLKNKLREVKRENKKYLIGNITNQIVQEYLRAIAHFDKKKKHDDSIEFTEGLAKFNEQEERYDYAATTYYKLSKKYAFINKIGDAGLSIIKAAQIAYKIGDLARAIDDYKQATNYCRRNGDYDSMAVCAENAADIVREYRSYDEAREYYEIAIENYKKTGQIEAAQECADKLERISH
ncbi:MAG: tetratricopeptide repeat protein [Candidatus Margulisbacteria bacterium]|nr:tetratricopeptide repeat protein [Candidatus Margulisiibacteriota bacterium]